VRRPQRGDSSEQVAEVARERAPRREDLPASRAIPVEQLAEAVHAGARVRPGIVGIAAALFVFPAVIFSQNLFTPLFWPALEAFAIFCCLSGAIYLINDVADADKDRLHPVKRRRPVASRALPRSAAGAIGVALLAAIVLRAVAGAAAVDVDISGWLVICTVLIALFLALGKRRHEYLTLEGDAAAHRPILAEYSEGFLDQMIAVVTASTVTAYALYTMSPETVAKFHTRLLPLTLPFVLYGVFRYLYLLYRRELGGNPSDLLLSDRGLLINSLLWIGALVAIIYGPSLPLDWLR
jgi:4-hydroxybenzoate polyprenyltransferase